MFPLKVTPPSHPKLTFSSQVDSGQPHHLLTSDFVCSVPAVGTLRELLTLGNKAESSFVAQDKKLLPDPPLTLDDELVTIRATEVGQDTAKAANIKLVHSRSVASPT